MIIEELHFKEVILTSAHLNKDRLSVSIGAKQKTDKERSRERERDNREQVNRENDESM